VFVPSYNCDLIAYEYGKWHGMCGSVIACFSSKVNVLWFEDDFYSKAFFAGSSDTEGTSDLFTGSYVSWEGFGLLISIYCFQKSD